MAALRSKRPDLSIVTRISVYDAIFSCESKEELIEFLDDLLTEGEIEKIRERWAIAQSKLATNCSLNLAMEFHSASQDLAQRVFSEIAQGSETGYRLAYKRLLGTPMDGV